MGDHQTLRRDFLSAQQAEWDEYTRRARAAGAETVCGPGSTLRFTEPLRHWLPILLAKHSIHSILDAPCGDFNWLRHVNLTGVDYTGWDINPPAGKQFERVNLLTKRTIPTVDLIMCRDFFAHIPDEFIAKLLLKFKKSGSRFLLATTFDTTNGYGPNPTDQDGFYYRPVNLEAPPFNLPAPVDALGEPGPEHSRKMGLFALQ